MAVSVLYVTDPRFFDHDTGPGHPERPSRLEAVHEGIRAAGVAEALIPLAPRFATRAELEVLHDPLLVDTIAHLSSRGGGNIDADTVASAGSFDAALLAAGAGLEAIDHLDAGEADAAFCAVRPPGHHATPARSMGFCLFNNVAVAAAHLAARGERVLIVDYDAHHGNGTQDAFYDDPRVAYVSWHQYPLYPGTGALRESGTGEGVGTTINLPMPVGSSGDAYREGFDRVIAPFAERFRPTWVLISAGFDAHRRDPLTGLELTAGDYADLTIALIQLVPPGRRLMFLEGGYDLEGLARSAGASVAALAGERFRPEDASEGDRGREVIPLVEAHHHQLLDRD